MAFEVLTQVVGSPTWNADPHPFTWVKTAVDSLASLADYLNKIRPYRNRRKRRVNLSPDLWRRTLGGGVNRRHAAERR